MSQVWEHSKGSGSALLVLLAVADFANDSGVAYPAVETLAIKSRMSERNCRYALDALVAAGELVIERNAGPRGCNLFRVQSLQGGANLAGVGVQTLAGVQSLQGCNPSSKGVQTLAGVGVQTLAPDPSLTVIEPSKRKAALRMEAFAHFWKVYPKKRSKGQALLAFTKINPDEQLMQAILAGIEQAKTWDDWRKESGKYIPYPATWLNARGWEDEGDLLSSPQKRVAVDF